MWLSLHDTLPIETFRFKRHLASSDMCKRCNKAQETMEHCLRDCERSKAIWYMLDPSILDSTAGTALEEWFRKALANNEASFGGYGDIGAMTYSTLTTLGQTIRLLPWPELPPRTYRFTGIEAMPLAGFGCIIRDSKGDWISGCSGSIPPWSIIRCELFAAWRGLVLAWDCGLRDIICETDCLDILPIMHELTKESSSLLHFKTQLTVDTTMYHCYFGDDDECECPHAYPKTRTWENGTDCCSWMGVTYDSMSGHVIGLDLSCSALVGNLDPNTTLFHLTHLHTLNLAHNDFYGSELPSQFGGFVNLTHLNLSSSVFKGDIPSQISHLSKLQSFDLSGNFGLKWKEITWKRMLQNATALREIVLDDTDMSSITIAPSHVSNWSLSFSLITLSLVRTGISGNLTSHILCLPNLYELNLNENENIQVHVPNLNCSTSSLSVLDLSWCQFPRSQIPSSFSNLTRLTSLHLSSSNLTGSISSMLSNIQHLAHLDLSNNKFSSSIPSFPSNIQYLIHLDLSFNGFNGSIRSLLLSNLKHLTHLDLSNNEFSGSIPSLLSNLQSLTHLDLSFNQFSGSIPSSLSNLQHLTHLDLSDNTFSGQIPNVLGQFPWHQLEYLDLSFNLLTDDNISFICIATSLQIVNLSHNKLRGTIPQCVANLSSLQVLDLQKNKLHGTLPSILPTNLITLNLNGNQLKGHLPRSLSNCTNLMDLNLGNNQIEDRFPHWLQSLQYLGILVLQSNKFYGPIANLKTKDMFPNVMIFDISSNNFSGQLPKAYIRSFQSMKSVVGAEVQSDFYYIQGGYSFTMSNINLDYDDSMTATIKGLITNFEKIPNILVSIDLSSNRFEGEIPYDFGELHALISLNLSHNSLNGTISHSLGNLTNLESLDLSSNMLTGKIPDELTNLNFLESLNLSNNHLEGSIPRGKQFDTFSNDSYEGNMGLCGFPLSVECNNNVPLQQDPPSEAEDKFGFGWKPVAIGYACGMVLGIGLGFCVFSIGKPQWLVIIFGGKIKRRSRGNRRARTT
ncbi:Receptor-like protein [Arachis hypogaea]|nr:Receptor-like protein [Arachis hypogaea]